jgi:small subunit ribosomal protein S13
MARIAGIDLPNKPLEIALTYIYGIGENFCQENL